MKGATLKAWHLRHARTLIYCVAAVSAIGVAITARSDPPTISAWLVSARELFALWSLGWLLAGLAIGPIVALFPAMPLRIHLMYGRRAIGMSAFAFAVAHVICYLAPVLARNWRELFSPGPLWIAGLALGVIAAIDMTALAITSRDAAVKRMGGRKWKRLHRTVYVLLAVALVHALLNGADFGIGRPPDIRGPRDTGALIGFLIATATWLGLFVLRRWKTKHRAVTPDTDAS